MNALLTLNAGSSSLKFALFPLEPALAPSPTVHGQVEGIGTHPHLLARDGDGRLYDEAIALPPGADQTAHHRAALAHLFAWISSHNAALRVVAAGHRVVHGGMGFSAPTLITEDVLATLESLVPLAPLHQPHNLRAIRALAELMPAIPQIACFDTAFHRSQPALAQAFALPRALSAEGVKRYGFHGLSYEYVARQLPRVLGEDTARGAVVIAHLGNGASMCALREGRSQASTMGFTALDGLVMGTRCGNLDPGVLLYLMEQKGMDAGALTRLLYKESGLLGVSGQSPDMRDLLASDSPEAHEAVELFCYRIARELGSMAAAAGGLEALVFTGGIGEHADAVRSRVVEHSHWLGLALDPGANRDHRPRIEKTGSRVKVAVVSTNEEWMIAHHAARLMQP